MNIRYVVELTDEKRAQLQELTRSGQAQVRRVKRAQIRLAAEQGQRDAAIAATLGVGTSTVYRVKRRFVEGCLMWCIPRVDAEYVARMEDGLDVYSEAPDPCRPVVFLDAPQPWRHVNVTDHKTAQDFAPCMYELATVHYPDAEMVRVVLDNLSSHKPGDT